MRYLIGLLFALVFALPGHAETPDLEGYSAQLFEQLHPEDQSLAEGWQTGLAKQLDLLEDDPEEFVVLDSIDEIRELIAAEHQPFSIEELDGNWRMRSLQASDLGAIAYQYFPARIYPAGEAYFFDKNTGSQRHRGLMAQLDEDTVFFVGALYYGYETPRLYSSQMVGETTPQQREFDAVAEIYKIGDDHFLMAFAPKNDSYRLYEIRK